MHIWQLSFAILLEVAGTTALKASNGFTNVTYGVLAVVFYCGSVYLLSLSLRIIPLGIAYAVWSGVGIIFAAGIGAVIFGQTLDWPAMLGIVMIIAGISVFYLFSGFQGET